jgi:V-type H+-transporting ATPase subunit H
LTLLISTAVVSSPKTSSREEGALPQVYSFLSSLSRNQDPGLQDIGVQGFSALLRSQEAREIFWDQRKETLYPLVGILRAAAETRDNGPSTLAGSVNLRNTDASIGGGISLQLLYHVLLVIWQLSYESSLVGQELES